MPEIIKLADGTEREVPTEEELKNLRAGHDANLEKKSILSKLNEMLGLEEGQTIEQKIDELKTSANPNWQKFRSTFNNMKKTLKEKGVEVDDETGEVKSNDRGFSRDEIVELVQNTMKEGLANFSTESSKNQLLSGYSEEDRKKIEPVFEKLQSLGGDASENLSLAEAKVFPGRNVNQVKNIFNNAGWHGAPSGQGRDDSYDKSSEGQSAASAMNLSFAKKDNK